MLLFTGVDFLPGGYYNGNNFLEGGAGMRNTLFRRALADTLPVMAGYLFLGFGFGVVMEQKGFGPGWALAMSALLYAGSMQYVAVGLLGTGADLLTVALTTFLVNARHLFYGISMVGPYREAGRKKPYLIFGLTDETYSLVSQGTADVDYCFRVTVLDHLYWIFGTAMGSGAGKWLPINYEGIDFVLTALFVTVFVEQWLTEKDHAPALMGVGLTAACLLIFGSDVFLLPAMGAIFGGLLLLGSGKEVQP